MAFEIPSEQLKQKVGIAGGVGKSLLHPLKKHIWDDDEDDHEDEDRFSFRALEVPELRVRKRPYSALIRPFPHSRFGHSQCPKRKSKTTFQ